MGAAVGADGDGTISDANSAAEMTVSKAMLMLWPCSPNGDVSGVVDMTISIANGGGRNDDWG